MHDTIDLSGAHDDGIATRPVAYDQRYALYISYAFAAFGDRMWEFSSLIIIMVIFPSSLLWSSLFGLCETIAAIIAGPYIGRFIDRSSRIAVIRTSIIGQNLNIAAACTLLYLLLIYDAGKDASQGMLYGSYSAITVLGMIVKVSSSINKVSIFKDWVPVLSRADLDARDNDVVRTSRLTSLNSVMRRIDLTCSIIAPMAAGGIESLTSPSMTVIVIGSWSIVSTMIEWQLVARAWRRIPLLREKKAIDHRNGDSGGVADTATVTAVVDATAASLPPPKNIPSEHTPLYNGNNSSSMDDTPTNNASTGAAAGDAPPLPPTKIGYWQSWRLYVTHTLFLPSLAYCMLYISLLSFGGLMVSYLSSSAIDLSPTLLAAGRAAAAIVGIIATMATPYMMTRLGSVRAGTLSIWLQVICLVPCVISFIIGSDGRWSRHIWLTAVFTSLITSRFGLWSFDLVCTQLMQDGIIHQHIGAINGTQESLMNMMYMASFVITMVWDNPLDFEYPVYISFASTSFAAILYTYWSSCKSSSRVFT